MIPSEGSLSRSKQSLKWQRHLGRGGHAQHSLLKTGLEPAPHSLPALRARLNFPPLKKKKNVLNRSSSHLQSDNFPKKKSGFFK